MIHTPITTWSAGSMGYLGISKPTPELYWAIPEFEGECFVLTDKKGRQ